MLLVIVEVVVVAHRDRMNADEEEEEEDKDAAEAEEEIQRSIVFRVKKLTAVTVVPNTTKCTLTQTMCVVTERFTNDELN